MGFIIRTQIRRAPDQDRILQLPTQAGVQVRPIALQGSG